VRLATVVVPRPTQPSILLVSVNEDQLRLGRQGQVWFIPFVDKCVFMQVNCEIHRQCVPFPSTSAVRLLHCGALYRVYDLYILPLLQYV